jgi:hypothetical protein
MSSKRVKRETIDLITPDRPLSERNKEERDVFAECERLQKEVAHKNEVRHTRSRPPGKSDVLGYQYAGRFCEQVTKGVMLWSVYRVALSAF